MIERGAEVRRFTTGRSREEGKKSAWEIIDAILVRVSREKNESKKKVSLQIQRELADYYNIIPQTEADKQLHCSIQKFAKIRKQMSELEVEMARNGAIATLEEIEETIQRLQDQIRSLKSLFASEFDDGSDSESSLPLFVT